MIINLLAAAVLAIWMFLLLGRGGFWRCSERDGATFPDPPIWPKVVAIVPARNEAEGIAQSIRSLIAQDYRGDFRVILVDDDSSDGTTELARKTAAAAASERLQAIRSQGPPMGWTGKLWAVKQGIDAAASVRPDYLLLTDADIVHAPDSVSRLVARAEHGGLALTSLMVKLRCVSVVERASIPAFVFFFQMLYPFSAVNRPQSSTAAAAGGCMLVRADALRRAGGIGIIRNALIDDCALAKALKPQGPIWLGLTERVHSIRAYPVLADIRRMVTRSAYAQLSYSPLLLIGTTAAMGLTYLGPPLLALFAEGVARAMGAAAWGLMAIAFQPTLRLYGRSPLWGVALPVIALQYLVFTLDSAYQHMRGRGGTWKGRVQAKLSEP